LKDLDDVFAALARSPFRQRMRLGPRETEYLQSKGLPVVVEHANDLIGKRLAPAAPLNDGKQTPFKGHPVFIAQHATATCCRGCLEKWHGIPKGKELLPGEKSHVVAALERWLRAQSD
jgi:hypothetical protein